MLGTGFLYSRRRTLDCTSRCEIMFADIVAGVAGQTKLCWCSSTSEDVVISESLGMKLVTCTNHSSPNYTTILNPKTLSPSLSFLLQQGPQLITHNS